MGQAGRGHRTFSQARRNRELIVSSRKRMMGDLDQDIRDFIERETQDNIERGMPPKEP